MIELMSIFKNYKSLKNCCYKIAISFFLFVFAYPNYASAQDSINLDIIEKNYFGKTYSNEDTNKRLDRLDKFLFGQISTKGIKDREDNILELYKKNLEAKKHFPVITDSKSDKSDNSNTNKQASTEAKKDIPQKNIKPKETIKTVKKQPTKKYPRLTFLESKVLRKTYPYQTPELRLERLEKQVLGKTNDNMPIDNRIAILNKIVNPKIVDNLDITPQPNQNYMPFYGYNNSINGNTIRQFNNLFNQLDRQFFGQDQFDEPDLRDFQDDRDFSPKPKNRMIIPPKIQPQQSIPPYNSPNTI